MKSLSSISLCMIVKNEEKNLQNCICSAKDYVNEIIVVDTGSKHKTIQIAKNLGCKVINSTWENNFSKARNLSLSFATCDWILILDADEHLPQSTAKHLNILTQNPYVDAWIFNIISPVSLKNDSLKNKYVNIRLFRNRPEYKFTGKIHEQIKPSIISHNPDSIIKYSNLSILHYGYVKGKEKFIHKNKRNITILEENIKDSPTDPFINFNLGTSYYTKGLLDKAKNHFEIALKYADYNENYTALLYRNYCLCLYDTGNYKKALDKADEAMGYYENYPDFYFVKGQIYLDAGILSKAKRYFLRCTDFKHIPPKYTTMDGINSWMAYENLAYIYEKEQNFEKAIYYTELALKNNFYIELFINLCRLLQKNNYKPGDIAKYTSEKLNISHDIIAKGLYEINEFGYCITYIKNNCIQNDKTSFILANALLKSKKYTEVLNILESIKPDSQIFESSLNPKCLALWLQQPAKDATQIIEKHKENSSAKVYQYINNVLINNEAPKIAPHLQNDNLILNISLKCLSNENIDLALKITQLTNVSFRESVFALTKYALE